MTTATGMTMKLRRTIDDDSNRNDDSNNDDNNNDDSNNDGDDNDSDGGSIMDSVEDTIRDSGIDFSFD